MMRPGFKTVLLRAGIALGILMVAFSAFVVWLFQPWVAPDWAERYPVECGTQSLGFEIRCAEDVPYLFEYGIPYPTPTEKDNHPELGLGGRWHLRLDPLDKGLASGWQHSQEVDDQWQEVSVPGTFNRRGTPHEDYQGYAWFHRSFRVPDSIHPGFWSRLTFEGVLLHSDVWLNGKWLGEREGGYTPFHFDISRELDPDGLNHLVLRVDNRLDAASLPPKVRSQHNHVWGHYAGIYRPARIEWLPPTYVFKNRWEAQVDSQGTALSGRLLVQSRDNVSSSAYRLEVSAFDADGHLVGSDTQIGNERDSVQAHRIRVPLEMARWYHPDSPELYSIRTVLTAGAGASASAETTWVRTGLRELAVVDASLLYNQRPLFLRGISKMEDHPDFGQTQTDSLIESDISMIRDMNANYIRLAHYAHDQRFVRAARDSGLLMAQEVPLFHAGAGWTQWFVDFQSPWYFPVSLFGVRHMMQRNLIAHAQRELLEMIERDGNNPAVILWTLGNESYSLFEGAGSFYGHLARTARVFDSTRLSTYAEMTYYLPFLDSRRRSFDHVDLSGLNLYFGWYYGHMSEAESHLDQVHARHPRAPLLLSEFGAEAALGRSDADGIHGGDRVFFPRTYSEEYQAELLRHHVQMARNRSYIIGVSPWVFSDFYCTWFPENPVPYYNTKGVTSARRSPKMGYHALRELYAEIAAEDAVPGPLADRYEKKKIVID